MPTIRPRHNVNLWRVPLQMSIAALALFALTMVPDMLAAYHVIHLPTWFSMGSIDDARAILSAMLGCVSTVLALIFSVTLLVLSMVANLFGPRLLYRFLQDWVAQVCIGLFMAAFIYVFLCFLVTHSDAHSTFIPQTCLITSWFVVLAAFAFLVFYSHRVAMLIQNPDAIGRIADDLRVAVNLPRVVHPAAAEPLTAVHRLAPTPLLSRHSGYIQDIDLPALVALAQQHDAFIRFTCRPGQFILEGESIAELRCAQPLDPTPILHAIAVGRHRVLSQDLEFGIAQIVEIAIRALSPAINDTFTGIACVDLLGESLTILATSRGEHTQWHDTAGILRLAKRPVPLHRLIRLAFDQIRQAAADNPAVLIRLLSTTGRLAHFVQHHSALEALLEEARATRETGLSKSPVTLDRQDIEQAWHHAEALLAERLTTLNAPTPAALP